LTNFFRLSWIRNVKQSDLETCLSSGGISIAAQSNDGLLVIWVQISGEAGYLQLAKNNWLLVVAEADDEEGVDLPECHHIASFTNIPSSKYPLSGC
jgi:hypothetical protein